VLTTILAITLVVQEEQSVLCLYLSVLLSCVLSVRTMIFKADDLQPRYLVYWLTITMSKKFKVIGQSSRSQQNIVVGVTSGDGFLDSSSLCCYFYA